MSSLVISKQISRNQALEILKEDPIKKHELSEDINLSDHQLNLSILSFGNTESNINDYVLDINASLNQVGFPYVLTTTD